MFFMLDIAFFQHLKIKLKSCRQKVDIHPSLFAHGVSVMAEINLFK
jgi:hypothetical protein